MRSARSLSGYSRRCICFKLKLQFNRSQSRSATAIADALRAQQASSIASSLRSLIEEFDALIKPFILDMDKNYC